MKAILRSSRVIYCDNQCVKSVAVILHQSCELSRAGVKNRMCSRSESVIPCITYVMIWVSLYTIAIYALCVCRRGIILMLRQESSLNDDPSFMAHEPKWCLSDSIKGLDKHQNSERQTHHRGGRLSGTNIFLPLPACVLLGNIYYFTSFENKINHF